MKEVAEGKEKYREKMKMKNEMWTKFWNNKGNRIAQNSYMIRCCLVSSVKLDTQILELKRLASEYLLWLSKNESD